MNSYLLNQYKHMHWANQQLISTLQQESTPPPEAIKLMAHVLAAEHLWLARLRGERERLAPWSTLTLPECAEYAAANATGYLELVSQVDEEQLREPVAFKLTNGTPMTSTRGDILCHVPLHGAHHRGQIARILTQNGVKPPLMDYIVYSMQTDG